MDYESSTQLLNTEGFSWARFRDIFPFGDISLREENYQKLVLKVLRFLESKGQKKLLLDLLDTQNCVFLEQVWIQNEQCTEEEKPFPIHGHFITAQLKINSNIRLVMDLEKIDSRTMMLNLAESERLLDRMNSGDK